MKRTTQPSRRADATDVRVTAPLDTPLGRLLAAATDEGICRLEFHDGKALPSGSDGDSSSALDHIRRLEQELAEYFAGKRTVFTVPLVYLGTAFQRAVWQQLLRIPYGETRCYHDIARAVRRPRGPRAVGQANGSNRLVILIPCHRVIAKDGGLGGYGCGLWRKQFLLDLERGATPRAVQRWSGRSRYDMMRYMKQTTHSSRRW